MDIYSLGIVLYKLRNHNRIPFINLEKQLITYRDKENALTRRMSGEALPPPVDAGEDFAGVILKACAYDREERYRTAGEFREALEALKYKKEENSRKKPDRRDFRNPGTESTKELRERRLPTGNRSPEEQ